MEAIALECCPTIAAPLHAADRQSDRDV